MIPKQTGLLIWEELCALQVKICRIVKVKETAATAAGSKKAKKMRLTAAANKTDDDIMSKWMLSEIHKNEEKVKLMIAQRELIELKNKTNFMVA